MRELFSESGQLRCVHEWPDSIAAAVSGIDVSVTGVTRLKLAPKAPALMLLFKHLALFDANASPGEPPIEPRVLTEGSRKTLPVASHDIPDVSQGHGTDGSPS